MSRFTIEQIEGDNRYFVKDNEQGWFIPTDSERQAEFIKERFEGVIVEKEPSTIEDYFTEWEKAINELSEKEVELINLKEVYAEKEQEIIQNTDFKELYGANNEKVRKNHIKKTLSAMTDAKNDLEVSIDYLRRRIDFIKSLMRMQGILIEAGVIE